MTREFKQLKKVKKGINFRKVKHDQKTLLMKKVPQIATRRDLAMVLENSSLQIFKDKLDYKKRLKSLMQPISGHKLPKRYSFNWETSLLKEEFLKKKCQKADKYRNQVKKIFKIKDKARKFLKNMRKGLKLKHRKRQFFMGDGLGITKLQPQRKMRNQAPSLAQAKPI